MSTHYESLQQSAAFIDGFGVEAPAELGAKDIWPRKPGFFICRVRRPLLRLKSWRNPCPQTRALRTAK